MSGTRKKKILLVEDTTVELANNGQELKEAGFEVISAGTTSKANASVDKHNGQFDCVIVDLNMNNRHIDDKDLAKLTHGGSLTGWIWLFFEARERINAREIIIYSEFITELEDYLLSATTDEKIYFKQVKSIPKTRAVNNSLYLVQEVEKLIGKGKK